MQVEEREDPLMRSGIELVFISNSDLITINLFLERVAIDTEHPGGFNLIAVIDAQSKFDKGLLNLFENNLMKAVEFDLCLLLLLEQDFQLATHQFFKTDGLKVCNEKIVRAVCSGIHLPMAPVSFQETLFLKENGNRVKLRECLVAKYICAAAIAAALSILNPEFFRPAIFLRQF